ncbi:MAG: HD domain-containing protein [Clostridia bacterium]|nr:HD domain-containing protein [Clostridia bacterium]
MRLPEDVLNLLNRLHQAGFSAYAVGGCVRDSLRGAEPKDWDLCTSALPEEMERIFAGERVVETGLKHGTLTVVIHHVPYEITTYRVDGAYTDHRHPDSVDFVDRVEEDLARRDFTINAMACDRDGKIMDLFEGQADLARGCIRCVGEAARRFGEDALRILRALRFASVLDFTIAPETDRAIRDLYPTMEKVAAERIREELVKLLCGPGAGRILRDYAEVITFLIPCLKPAVGYDQENPHHLYTVWEHTVRAVENVPADPVLRMTMLLHDSGKPFTRTTDARGVGHYAGHQAYSARLAAETLDHLRFDRETRDRIIRLVEGHDIPLSTEKKLLLRRLNRYGEKDLRALFRIHLADRIATGTRNPEHARAHFLELNAALDALLAERPCFTLKDLRIRGTELMEIGFREKEIGEELRRLLEEVMDGRLENETEALRAAAKARKQGAGEEKA